MLHIFFIISYIFSSTKLENKAEQVLPGRGGARGEREGARGRKERWPKQYIHIGINVQTNKKIILYSSVNTGNTVLSPFELM
jgi:hypothetical protein